MEGKIEGRSELWELGGEVSPRRLEEEVESNQA